MKVLFLDIDGVLNSTKTALVKGGYPHKLTEKDKFDEVAITLIRRLCEHGEISIVLSSAWRLSFPHHAVAGAFDLPIISRTPLLADSPRGDEIRAWLEAHPSVVTYAIVDDDPDMLEYQMPRFVKTDGNEGLTWKNFTQLCELLDVKPFDCHKPNRTDINGGKQP